MRLSRIIGALGLVGVLASAAPVAAQARGYGYHGMHRHMGYHMMHRHPMMMHPHHMMHHFR